MVNFCGRRAGLAGLALLISTTYSVHEDIEQLFQTFRDTHFGSDPVMERVQVPANGGLGGGGFF